MYIYTCCSAKGRVSARKTSSLGASGGSGAFALLAVLLAVYDLTPCVPIPHGVPARGFKPIAMHIICCSERSAYAAPTTARATTTRTISALFAATVSIDTKTMSFCSGLHLFLLAPPRPCSLATRAGPLPASRPSGPNSPRMKPTGKQRKTLLVLGAVEHPLVSLPKINQKAVEYVSQRANDP